MGDAPERIWADTYSGHTSEGYWGGHPITPNKPENQGIEYIRADVHTAALAENAALRAHIAAIGKGDEPVSDGGVSWQNRLAF